MNKEVVILVDRVILGVLVLHYVYFAGDAEGAGDYSRGIAGAVWGGALWES